MIPLAIICTAITLGMIAKDIINDEQQLSNFDMKQNKMNEIIQRVSNASGIPVEKIKGKSRRREVVVARQITAYLIKSYFGELITWQAMSDFMGKDHATMIYSVKTVSNGINTKDKLFLELLEQLNEKQAA